VTQFDLFQTAFCWRLVNALLTKKPHRLITFITPASRCVLLRLRGQLRLRGGRGMNWDTSLLAGGTVLLALALGGVRGLLVVLALLASHWLIRSIGIAGAAHHEKRSQEDSAHQSEAESKPEHEGQSQQRRRQAEQECESEIRRQRQSERVPNRLQQNKWWSVLEVPPHASLDEIRHAYRRKIKQCHPDRVRGPAPELLEWAERCTRTLNAAYSEANRARRSQSATS
jgi:hypothetical protein